MCGICGVFGKTDEQTIERMCSAMRHRGPDDSGLFCDERAVIGSRRLSIVDVSGGRQPLHNEDGTIHVVCNGEIYNYPDLRKRLLAGGHTLETQSDSEAIIHLYEEMGVECLQELRGMFGLALWDSRNGRMLIARDRLGIKPLYYTETGGKLVFGSEIKAVLEHPDVPREMNPLAVDAYLTLEYVPGPLTMFQGIHKLMPGHYILADAAGIRIERYWDVEFGGSDLSEGEALARLETMLDETVASHLMSDVPLGALLSGGIDSACVVGLMSRHCSQPVKTYTVGFDVGGEFNELTYARMTAKAFGTEHHELLATCEDAELLPKLVWHMDEPVADRAALPTYLVCKFARESVKVVLTGEGSDEFFGGYPRYAWFMRAKRLESVPALVRAGALSAIRGVTGRNSALSRRADQLLGRKTDVERHLAWISNHLPEEKAALYLPEFRRSVGEGIVRSAIEDYLERGDGLHGLMYLDVKTWLVDDVLMKMDKMSMAASLEARVPFLDHLLVEYAASLSPDLKIRGMTTKYLLKKAVADLLPAEIVHRKKHPCVVTVAHWLRNGLRPMAEEALISDSSPLPGIFDRKYMRWMLEEHIDGRRDLNRRIWSLMCLSFWCGEFVN